MLACQQQKYALYLIQGMTFAYNYLFLDKGSRMAIDGEDEEGNNDEGI